MTAGTAGTYQAGLRFSNGPNPFVGPKTVSLYVNGVKQRQVTMGNTGNWDTWSTITESVVLNAGPTPSRSSTTAATPGTSTWTR
ncbi:hypothetical protein ACFQZ4_12600 [Catellatospora coxensis]